MTEAVKHSVLNSSCNAKIFSFCWISLVFTKAQILLGRSWLKNCSEQPLEYRVFSLLCFSICYRILEKLKICNFDWTPLCFKTNYRVRKLGMDWTARYIWQIPFCSPFCCKMAKLIKINGGCLTMSWIALSIQNILLLHANYSQLFQY